MKQCKCGSWAINHHLHGRDGTDDDLCDVCYWRKRAALAESDSPSDKSDIVVGGIVQVRPDIETFGACMVTVTEVKNWGVMGYVQSAGVNGQQYIRLKTEDIEPTGGVAVWVVGGNDD